MSGDRPAIPAAVKRAVRRECGFGCVICGAPVFHYDHIVDYAEVGDHTVQNLALLCPGHHQEKTSKRLPREVVARARLNPLNRTRSHTSPERWFFSEGAVDFMVGSNLFRFGFSQAQSAEPEERVAIEINGVNMLSMKLDEGDLLLSVQLFDTKGNQILRVIDGELVVSTKIADYNLVGPRLTLVDVEGSAVIDLEKCSNGVRIHRGIFHEGMTRLVIDGDSVLVEPEGHVISNNLIIDAPAGIQVRGPRFQVAANDSSFLA